MMKFEILIKYLKFLQTECLKHSNDESVDENELQLFKLEVKKFKQTLNKSDLSSTIKDKVNHIDFDLSLPKFKGFNLLAYLTKDHWNNDRDIGGYLSNRFKEISEEIEKTIFELKANS